MRPRSLSGFVVNLLLLCIRAADQDLGRVLLACPCDVVEAFCSTHPGISSLGRFVSLLEASELSFDVGNRTLCNYPGMTK